ncbi:MAG: hypothetical protein M1828_002205 [Chrysothrix sp. TS-e1954]|nr:MAG: hypothetical protein M1828_002205 [Chrysothrix sp. TS-e1954]
MPPAPFLPQRTTTRCNFRPLFILLSVSLLFGVWFLMSCYSGTIKHGTPLVEQYVEYGHGEGGRWYIPNSWRETAIAESTSSTPILSNLHPTTVLEAAELALELALRNDQYIEHSKIPLVAHQTWKDFDTAHWSPYVRESVDGWLQAAGGGSSVGDYEMAYILWDDRGTESLMNQYEPQIWDAFTRLPYNVEKADTFRVTVLRWFGGIYADVDVNLIQHPAEWIHDEDLTDWTDSWTEDTYSLSVPKTKRYLAPVTSPSVYQKLLSAYRQSTVDVGAIFGIEADNPSDTDAFWRMGYSFPVQITNWAFAMAPHHPTALGFLAQLETEIALNSTRLPKIDPLDLTGPPALTKAVKTHCESMSPSFRWDALSGGNDTQGGRGKVAAGDVLILPITGFSPGRGNFHRMGSEPLSHPNARLYHSAAGSWRKVDLKVKVAQPPMFPATYHRFSGKPDMAVYLCINQVLDLRGRQRHSEQAKTEHLQYGISRPQLLKITNETDVLNFLYTLGRYEV